MTGADDNLKTLQLVIDNAEPAPPPKAESPPAKPKRNPYGLAEHCPVVPLGLNDDVFYYLDATRQLRALAARDHSRLGCLALFGAETGFLYESWPRMDKDGNVTGWRPEAASEALMRACARRGVWDVFGHVRGPGAWLEDDGTLIWHCGDALLRGSGSPLPFSLPGQIADFIYPAAAAGPRPSPMPALAGPEGPAMRLLAVFKTWNWARGSVDAQLMLGWIGAAMLGGALKWRPLAWVTGDRFTGKTTLHELIKAVLGEAILSASDPSAAGIWQTLGHASLPVAVDEIEAEEDNRKAQAIIKLARQAASGGVVLRGGADHHGSQFTARSCFLFSSILVPPLMGQDRSRMAILELGRLEGRAPVDLNRARNAQLGAQLRRRLVDHWPRFGDTLEAYRGALIDAGHTGRGADQFGTLLAAADLLLHDDAPTSDELEQWGEALRAQNLAEHADDAADHERCLAHILSYSVDAYRSGARVVLGQYIAFAAGREDPDSTAQVSVREANEVLGVYGLRVVREDGRSFLAIANSHHGLAGLFQHTHWAGRSGTSGVWAQALRRISGSIAATKTIRFRAIPARATLVPIESVLGEGIE